MSSVKVNDKQCKLAYAADGTMICDPKQKPNVQGAYYGAPDKEASCPKDNCVVFGKVCLPMPNTKQ